MRHNPRSPSFRGLVAGLALCLSAVTAQAMDTRDIKTPGGLTVWHVEDDTNPLIAMSFAFKGGAVQDSDEKLGATSLMVSLLTEGAGDIDSRGFKERLRDTAVRLSFSSSADTISGSMTTLSTRTKDAAELLKLSLTAPRFDQVDLDRIRDQVIIGLKRAETDPQSIAGELFRTTVFPGHPYERDRRGTEETLNDITRDDLKALHKNLFAKDVLYVSIVGDISADDAAALVDDVFGSLPDTAKLKDIESIEPTLAKTVLDREIDVPQSVVQFALPGLKRDHPDFITAFVVNHIFGGGSFSSRLFNEVREERGLAYSVFSYQLPREYTALSAGGAATENARVAEALSVIADEIAKIGADGPTEEELANAKRFLTGSFALRFDSSSSIARQLLGQQLDDLGLDYVEKRNSLIEAVTLEDAKRVAKEIYDPEQLTFFVVGKPEADLSAVFGG